MKTLSQALIVLSEIENKLLESDGEISFDLDELMNEVDQTLAIKADQYSFVMNRFDTLSDEWIKKADAYYRVAKSYKELNKKIRDRLKALMVFHEMTELKGEDVRFLLTRNKDQLVIDETKLSDKYKKQTISWKPDRPQIELDLSAGANVEGVHTEPVFSLREYLNKEPK